MESTQASPTTPWVTIVVIISAVIFGSIAWLYFSADEEVIIKPIAVEKIATPVIEPKKEIEPEIAIVETPSEEIVEEVAQEPLKPLLPTLDESDLWLQEKLPTITWRKELLKLVINEDMIRRLVVFTDNFAQGMIAYEHSPLVKPTSSFSAREIIENGTTLIKWDETSSRRFSLYVDLLRSVDSEELVSWYFELKPLIDQAYQELGYPGENFTDIMQDAITKVLDMELPKERLELIRPSVMYQFKNKEIEKLDDVDKLLLRLGKENLLVLKSVLLEFNEKLSRGRP